MLVGLLGSVRLIDPPQRAADARQLRAGGALRDLEKDLLVGRRGHGRDLPHFVERKLPGLECRGDPRQEGQRVSDSQQLGARVHVEPGLDRQPVRVGADSAIAPATHGVEFRARHRHLRQRHVSVCRELANPVIELFCALLVFRAYAGVLHA